MLPAALALIGAVVYGSADFLGGLAARRLRSIVVTAVAALAGLVALGLVQPLLGGVWTTADVAWGVLGGIVSVVAIALLYACLAIGPMSILSPLTAVVSAIAPIVWALVVEGETLSWVGYAGLAVALDGERPHDRCDRRDDGSERRQDAHGADRQARIQEHDRDGPRDAREGAPRDVGRDPGAADQGIGGEQQHEARRGGDGGHDDRAEAPRGEPAQEVG